MQSSVQKGADGFTPVFTWKHLNVNTFGAIGVNMNHSRQWKTINL